MMSPGHRRFVRRGSYGNWTVDRNRRKLDEIALNPRLLRDTSGRDLSTTVLGQKVSSPVMCAPAGGQCGSHPDGELATARAAGQQIRSWCFRSGRDTRSRRWPRRRAAPSGFSTSTTATA